MSNRRIITGVLIVLGLIGGIIGGLLIAKNQIVYQCAIPPEAGELNIYLGGLEVYNPYDGGATSVILKTTNEGGVEIDSGRTSWWATDSRTYHGDFDTTTFNEIDYERFISNPSSYPNNWIYGPTEDINKWASNDWSLSSCNIDVDTQKTGVPNIIARYVNLYPSDSNGDKADDYGHYVIEQTAIDEEGNTRDYEVHVGYVVAEFDFIIQANARLDERDGTFAPNGLAYANAEVFGTWYGGPTYSLSLQIHEWMGASVDASVSYMVDIESLKLEDEFTINPEWLNLGNGILEVKKVGFDNYVDTAENGWKKEGSNNVEAGAYGVLDRFETREDALDKVSLLPELDEYDIDFATRAPKKCYFNLDYEADLGYDWETSDAWNLYTDVDSVIFQELEFTQKVLIKFHTSYTPPLGPDGNDPLTISRITSDRDDFDPDKGSLWKQAWDWLVTNLFGGREWLAILTFVGIGLAVVVIGFLIFIVTVFGPGALLIPFKAMTKGG